MKKHIDITPALSQKLFYKPAKRPKTVINILLFSVIFLLGLLIMTSTVFYNHYNYSFFLYNQSNQIRLELVQKEAEKNNIEKQLKNLISSQEYSEYDVVQLASLIQESLKTASGVNKEFLQKAIPQAIRIQQRYDIPASAVLGQAIYESGYGKSQLAKQANNYFGLKALSKDWQGEVVWMVTKDYNKTVTHKQPFRKFDSVYDGFSGYVEFLKSYSRYKNVFKAKTGKDFVNRVAKAGYCNDSFYIKDVHAIIDRHKFENLDKILEKNKILSYEMAKN